MNRRPIRQRRVLGAVAVAAALAVGTGAAHAQLAQNLFRADNGTAYQVLRFAGAGSAERTRITTIAASLSGAGACASPGAGSGDPVSAAGGVLTGVMTLYPYDQVRRTGIVAPNDIDTVTFDAAAGGRLTLGTDINVCASSADCMGTPNPQVLVPLDSSTGAVPAACIANGVLAACEVNPRTAFAFGLPGAGVPPICLSQPTVNATVCGPEPSDGVALPAGGAIVFIYSGGPELCVSGVATASGAFNITADPDSGLMCGANSVVGASAVSNSAPAPPPDVCVTSTPTGTATTTATGNPPGNTATQTITPTPTLSTVPTTTATPALASPARGAGVLHYPLVRVGDDVNTLIQLSNVGDDATDVLCFYENVNGHCGASGPVCRVDADCPDNVACVAGYAVQSFPFHLASHQPVVWTARSGLTEVPPPGSGSIPAVPEIPFTGLLRCVQVAANNTPPLGQPTSLTGNATIETLQNDALDAASYTAIGNEGVNSDGNGHLQLGGASGEYAACGGTAILPHLFTPARDLATQEDDVDTELVLVPCAADYGREQAVPQQPVFLAFDEFDTRLSSVGPTVQGQLFRRLADVGLIFDSGLRGSLAGQTRITALNGEFLVLAVETHHHGNDAHAAIHPAFQQGETELGSRIDLYPVCAGDCNGDDQVGLDELVRCLQIVNGMDNLTRADCAACDADRSGTVDMGELIMALQSSTGTCTQK